MIKAFLKSAINRFFARLGYEPIRHMEGPGLFVKATTAEKSTMWFRTLCTLSRVGSPPFKIMVEGPSTIEMWRGCK